MNYLLIPPILILALILFVFNTSSFPLISPDEPRYAETAREMLESAQYITPFCNYIPRFDKPILFYWLELLSFKAFGLNESAARLPSVISATGMVWLAYLIGNLHGFPVIASFVTATTLGIFIASKLAITDMTLCFFISAALVFFYLGYCKIFYQKAQFAFKKRISSRWFISSIMMMGFGFLTKGPVALVLPLLVIVIFLLMQKSLREFVQNTWIDLTLGLILFLAINLPWYLAVHFETHGEFTKEFFLSHNFNRFTSAHTGHGAPIWFYLPVIVIGFFPWSFFIIPALTQSFNNRDFAPKLNLQSDKARIAQTVNFTLLWAIVVFIFFSISQTKLPTYILPIFLPLAILVSNWWATKFNATKSTSYRNQDAFWGLMFIIIFIIAADVIYFMFLKNKLATIQAGAFFVPLAIISFVFLAACVIAATAIYGQALVSFGFLFFATLACLLVCSHLVLRPFSIARDAGIKAFAKQLQVGHEVNVYQLHPTKIAFYSQRKVSKMGKKKLFDYLSEENTENERFFVYKTRHEANVKQGLAKIAEEREYDGIESQYKTIQSNPRFTIIQKIDLIQEDTSQVSLEQA